MKKAKKLLAKLMVLTLILAYIPTPVQDVSAASSKINTKMYTISKKAGTYTSAFKITITAKKGYKVYYSTGSSLSIKKVIKSGKKKTIKISKTTTLKIYAVKKSTIITKKKLKTSTVKKKTKSYKYTIKAADSTTDTTTTDTTTTSNDNTTSTSTNTDTSSSEATTTQQNENTNTPPNENGQGNSNTYETKSQAEVQSAIDSGINNASTVVTNAGNNIPTGTTVSGDTIATLTLSALPESSEDVTVATDSESAITTVTFNKAGNYILTGTSSGSTIFKLADSVTDPVGITLNNATIDNSGITTGNNPVIYSAKADLTITLVGDSVIKGASDYDTKKPASAIIYDDNSESVITINGTGSLSITDMMDKALADYNGKDPTDGISSKGTLVINSGSITVNSNGDCLKGTGSDGNGGVTINGGTLSITSKYGNGIKSKNGTINIADGTVNILGCAEDGINAKNYTVFISGGTVNIGAVNDNTGICYGDGIQGEYVIISDGTINIATAYEYAATNFYDKALTTYNEIEKECQVGSETKTETIRIDTGSHKGIKAGTKAKSYIYESVEDGSDYTANETYTQNASGGLTITSGTINIDTTKTGIKYNGSINGSGAAYEDQYIIGSPEDGIQSNYTANITGGTITIKAADDGISVADTLNIMNSASIDIQTAYEGIESGEINIGKSQSSTSAPTVKVYTNDDGINAAKKTNVTYTYADEDEATYTKVSTAGSGNSLSITDGSLYVCIADDSTHKANLTSIATTYSSTTSYTESYNSSGDGIDCNGSFYAYGGTVIVNGQKDTNNSPIDTDENYLIGEGATILAFGGNMDGGPSSVSQAYITTTGSSIGSKGSSIEIQDSNGTKLFSSADYSVTLKSSIPYLLFTSPDITEGNSYKVVIGGATVATLTATASASSGGMGGVTPPEMPGNNNGGSGTPPEMPSGMGGGFNH